jgi:hypothetical protein
MFKHFYSKNEFYAPLKVSILTTYKLTIPIGCVVISKRNQPSVKAMMNKFYIAKIWRAGGYEEKTLMEILKFCFSNIPNCTKVISSGYSENTYFVNLLMGTGF